MIGYVEGTRVAALPDSVVILTAGGVGYQLFLPTPLLARQEGQDGILRYFVSTVVRDNEIALYGFHEVQSKTPLELLLKVTGVGPKAALSLLSALRTTEVIEAAATENSRLQGPIS